MQTCNASIALGSPVFQDPRLASLAAEEGNASAWLSLLAHGDAAEIANVGGDFATVTVLAGGKTIAAIDRFATQSLCYRVDGNEIRFASRADELAGPNPDLDPQAIFDYLYFHCVPSPRTIFKNVHRLPPGHYATFDAGQLTVAPYWRPRFAPDSSWQFETARDKFRSLLKDAVATQLDGGKPGCFLSGGTDSSTIAGMIREATGQQPATYSIGFEAQGYDEMAFARIAARHFDTEHHEYYVTPDDLVRSIADVASHYDQPFGNSSALPAYYCAQMARQDGVTRLLAGDGGDELFGGNSRYAKQRIFGLWASVPAPLRHGLMEPLFDNAWAARTPLLKKAHSYIEQARVDMPARLQMYNLLLRLGINEVLTPQFLAEVDVNGPAKHQQAVWSDVGPASELNKTLAFDWRYTLAESDLPKVRETTRLADVGVGFPMLDKALLDFSLTLPDNFKLRGLKLRWFFKEALRGFLPDEILVKKKQGFGLPFGVWMTQHANLHALAADSLQTLSERGIVRPEFITRLLSQHLREHPGYYGEKVWVLMMLEQWLRKAAPDWRMSD